MATAVQVESLWNGLTDNSGQPLGNGKVYCYYAGTTTPAPLYTSSDKTSQATNPLILDGYGRAQVWADGRLKFVVKTSADVTLYTLDNLLYGFDDSTVLWGGQSTGAANAQVVSVPATIGTYSNGQQVTFIAGYTNSGAATLQFNALSAVSIVKGPTPSSLQAGDLIAGNVYTATYEAYSGTGRFRLSDYPSVADFQLSRAQYATAVFGATTITASLTPALISYEAGMVIRFKAVGNNTGPSTLNLNGLGAKAIQYQNAALVGGELGSNIVHELMYDGTQFQLLNPVNVATPLWGGTTGGTSTAYTITPAPAVTAYATGQRFTFKAHAANGATPTIAINGLAAKTIQYQNSALVSGEIALNNSHDVVYDGTNFQLLNPSMNASSRVVPVSVGQLQDGAVIWCGASSGAADAQTLTPSPAITSYVAGQRFVFKAGFSNTGSCTLNINGLGAKSVVSSLTGLSLFAGSITANLISHVIYDGTQFQILNPQSSWISYTPSLTQSTAITFTNNYCKYSVTGRVVTYQGSLLATNSGTASSGINVSLPVAAASSSIFRTIGAATFYDTSANTMYMLAAYTDNIGNIRFIGDTTTGNNFGIVPAITMAAGDYINFSATYEI